MFLGFARMAISALAGTNALTKPYPWRLPLPRNGSLRYVLFLLVFTLFSNPITVYANTENSSIKLYNHSSERILEMILENIGDTAGLPAFRSSPFLFDSFHIFLWHDQTWLRSIGPGGRIAPRDSIVADDGLLVYLDAVFRTSLGVCTAPRGVVREAPTRVWNLLTAAEMIRFRAHFEDQVRIRSSLNVTPVADADRGPDGTNFRVDFVVEIRPLRSPEPAVTLNFSIRSGQINTSGDLLSASARNLAAIGCAIGRLVS